MSYLVVGMYVIKGTIFQKLSEHDVDSSIIDDAENSSLFIPLKASQHNYSMVEVYYSLASSPGPKRGPGTHCLRMRQSVPKILVHRIFP